MARIGGFNVIGAILDKYTRLGGERGLLGPPTTNETPTPDGRGRFNHFRNGGSIYWTPQTGAFEVHGDIRVKWSRLGWERSVLGYPITDETPTPDGRGRFNHFQNGSIYWTQQTGAWEVHGYIRTKWSQMGWERSYLGYPISDELATPDGRGRVSYFQNGAIFWYPDRGAFDERGVKPGGGPSTGGAPGGGGGAGGIAGVPDLTGTWKSQWKWEGRHTVVVQKAPGGYSFRWNDGLTGTLTVDGKLLVMQHTIGGKTFKYITTKADVKSNYIGWGTPPPNMSHDNWSR